jgi:hypothetical protein
MGHAQLRQGEDFTRAVIGSFANLPLDPLLVQGSRAGRGEPKLFWIFGNVETPVVTSKK